MPVVGFDLGYLSTIQHLLGDNVGTLTAAGTAGTPTLTLDNGPDGSSGNVEPSAAAVAAAARTRSALAGGAGGVADTITLSPAAQHALSQDQIALSVLLGKKADEVKAVSVPTAASSGQDAAVQPAPSVAAQIYSIIAQKKAELDGPDALYQIADAQTVSDYVTWGLSDQAKASFQQAFANHTLQTQDLSTLPSLGYVEDTQVTGTSQTETVGWNEQAWNQLRAANNGNVGFIGLPLVGGLLVTWV